MPFQTTDSDIQENRDNTTSFQSQESTTETELYSRNADGTEPQREDGTNASEVNPRKLLPDPNVDDIRWLARTSWGGKLVTKPVDDSFKYGFEIKNEVGENDESVEEILERLDWEDKYKRAQKKARRDGFCIVYGILEDSRQSVNSDPLSEEVNVADVNRLKILRLDDLAKFNDNHPGTASGRGRDSLREGIADMTDHKPEDLEIRKTGIVIDKDPGSPTYREPVGYLVGRDDPKGLEEIDFLHHNRVVHHLTWNDWVDADLDSNTLGRWEGDSVLTSSYHLLNGLKKGNWSIMQTVFRYAAKLYHVELPEDADEEDFDNATDEMTNMNAMTELVTPFGYEIEDYGTDGQLEPRDYFDVIFEQICAGQEMTKSVLFGTQTGTVSGSETDIKNYYNQVERFRSTDVVNDMHGFVTWYRRLTDDRTDNEEFRADFTVEWGPLFRLTELDRAEALTRQMQTLSAAINNFVMTPQEARSILQEQWAEANIDWSDEFSQEEEDFLKTLNIAQLGTEAALPPEESNKVEQGSTQQQNGGGRTQGETSDPDDPTSDRGLSSREMDEIADRVARRLQ